MQDNAAWPEHFALLTFAGLRLLIPQSDIRSLEPALDITPCFEPIGSVGQLTQEGAVWSLYALSSELSLLPDCPDNYRIVILMKNVQSRYGLLCEDIETIARSQMSIHSVPAIMNAENSPLLAFAIYEDQVLYISSASALSQLFPHEHE
jgi:hypothetical protein